MTDIITPIDKEDSVDGEIKAVYKRRSTQHPYRGHYCNSCGQPIKFKDKSKKLHGLIYAHKVSPALNVVLSNMTMTEAADRMGLNRYTLYEIKAERVKTVRKDTAARILTLAKSLKS